MAELLFHPDVSAEVKAAYHWYQQQAEGLGDDFVVELESVYQKVIDNPQRPKVFQKGFRRSSLFRFPFSVIYRESEDCIYVVAVMHKRRKPGYWLSRVG